jgi:hypothetical protein
MAFIYLSGGYVIKVPGTRGETANLLSDLSHPFVDFETEAQGTSAAVPVIVNALQVALISDEPLPSKL